MKYLIVLIALLSCGCATTYSLVKVEKVGPTEVEIWRNNRTKLCERRIYLDSMYYKTIVKCPDGIINTKVVR